MKDSVMVTTEKGTLAYRIVDPLYGSVTVMKGNDFPKHYYEFSLLGCISNKDTSLSDVEWYYPIVGEYVVVRTFSRHRRFISSRIINITSLKNKKLI